MRIALLLVFVAYPLLELALLIRAGQAWGFWPVFGAVLATAALGVAIVRRQGFKAAEKISAELNAGRAPVAPLIDSGLVLAAGACLISPGLIGDVIGLLLLIPQVRQLIRHAVAAKLASSTTVIVRRTTVERREVSDAPTIEGEWQRIDDEPQNRP